MFLQKALKPLADISHTHMNRVLRDFHHDAVALATQHRPGEEPQLLAAYKESPHLSRLLGNTKLARRQAFGQSAQEQALAASLSRTIQQAKASMPRHLATFEVMCLTYPFVDQYTRSSLCNSLGLSHNMVDATRSAKRQHGGMLPPHPSNKPKLSRDRGGAGMRQRLAECAQSSGDVLCTRAINAAYKLLTCQDGTACPRCHALAVHL